MRDSLNIEPTLKARAVARKLARGVEGMPYREAIHLIDTALDHLSHVEYAVERDSDMDPLGLGAEREFDEWKDGLDVNSKLLVERLEFNYMVALLATRPRRRHDD